jgi:hypothetical protein
MDYYWGHGTNLELRPRKDFSPWEHPRLLPEASTSRF